MFDEIRKQTNQLISSVEIGEKTLEELELEHEAHGQIPASQITVEEDTYYRALGNAIDQITLKQM